MSYKTISKVISCMARIRKPLASAILLSVVVLPSMPRIAFAQDIELDKILAIVNDGVVLDSELRSTIAFFKQQSASESQTLPPENIIAERLLDQLIDREVMRQHARTIGVSVDPGSVNRALEQIASNNNMDVLRFRETLRQQGIDYEMFRTNIEQDLLVQRLIERDVQSRIRVSQQEIDDFVDSQKNNSAENQQYRIGHILIAAPPGANDELLATANDRVQAVLEQLEAGEEFAQVAASSSDGARALQGGDLGWRNLQELPEFLSTAARDMNVGDVAGPLRSTNGFHIVQLFDLQNNDPTSRQETLARHIFISGNAPEIQQTLANVRTEIINGRAFGDVAKELSEDPNSADNGGELPWFTVDQMPPRMEQTANTLAANTISEPFRTQFGWHLLEVLDRRERTVDEQALRDEANNALRQRKLEQETQTWARQLRDESFVEVRS